MRTPNYFCTWSVQNYAYGCNDEDFLPQEAEGAQGAVHARQSMNQQSLFSSQGWVRSFYPAVRHHLYFLLDDGWDIPLNGDSRWFGSLIPSGERFPQAPQEPLAKLVWLNKQVQKAGWRGLGLWVAAQEAPALFDSENLSLEKQKAYWVERLLWSEEAGIEYWKVDWGLHQKNWSFRKQLTQWGREFAPNLIIEHALCQGPVNDEAFIGKAIKNLTPQNTVQGRISKEIIAQEADLLKEVDVLRTYDVLQPLSPVQTLDRVAALLKSMENAKPNGLALINCEDECYLAAALGLCSAVMRHPLHGLRTKGDMDLFFPHMQGNAKFRMDEVSRMAKWQQIMPAFGASQEPVYIHEQLLQDYWQFQQGETWLHSLIDKTVVQYAPAAVSRGLPLPVVYCDKEDARPFVVASLHQNSAAIATLPRTQLAQKTPLATIHLALPTQVNHLAVFGFYHNLRITGFAKDCRQVTAKDLLGGSAVTLTLKEGALTLTEDQITSIGLAMATPGDQSSPGLLLTIH